MTTRTFSASSCSSKVESAKLSSALPCAFFNSIFTLLTSFDIYFNSLFISFLVFTFSINVSFTFSNFFSSSNCISTIIDMILASISSGVNGLTLSSTQSKNLLQHYYPNPIIYGVAAVDSVKLE